MELFSPSSWLQGFYLAALRAAAEMADALGDTEFAAKCRRLFKNSSQYIEKELFNGEYYVQKIDITDRSLVDQIVAQWHAHLYGLGDIFDREHRRSALRAIYRNNYKPSLRNFANPWRVFALQDEGGAIMCDYPKGAKKPAIPISYCVECMSGFEYALAGLLLAEGMKDEAHEIVKSVRDRYDGKNAIRSARSNAVATMPAPWHHGPLSLFFQASRLT
ncbi:MAG: hypothetical protein IJ009_07855 [Clostridia bacterium]|nr:hypothetical protein [Clostridia bacterium]